MAFILLSSLLPLAAATASCSTCGTAPFENDSAFDKVEGLRVDDPLADFYNVDERRCAMLCDWALPCRAFKYVPSKHQCTLGAMIDEDDEAPMDGARVFVKLPKKPEGDSCMDKDEVLKYQRDSTAETSPKSDGTEQTKGTTHSGIESTPASTLPQTSSSQTPGTPAPTVVVPTPPLTAPPTQTTTTTVKAAPIRPWGEVTYGDSVMCKYSVCRCEEGQVMIVTKPDQKYYMGYGITKEGVSWLVLGEDNRNKQEVRLVKSIECEPSPHKSQPLCPGVVLSQGKYNSAGGCDSGAFKMAFDVGKNHRCESSSVMDCTSSGYRCNGQEFDLAYVAC